MSHNDSLSDSNFKQHIDPSIIDGLQDIIILQEVGSTNDYLFSVEPPLPEHAIVCMAEHQIAGKGTKGRIWHSKFGSSLIYSIAWSFSKTVKNLSALSLAVGVIAQQALEKQGFSNVQLKWPNDLLVGNAKLGGILIEVKQQSGRLHLVCGIGINILNTLDAELIDQDFISLDQEDVAKHCSRNKLAADLSSGLIGLFSDYPDSGFVPWQARWQELHALQNKTITVSQLDKVFRGEAIGVNEDGALLINTAQGLESIYSADIT